ncbi:MAG: hypothetical protein RSC06_15640, partial [Clostridia bacterium]
NASVPFNLLVNDQSTDIAYALGSGDFVFAATGNYYVTWSLNVKDSTNAVSLSLRVGSTIVATIDGYVSRGQINGSALITISGVPGVVSLINTSGSAINFDTATSILANLVVLQVG